jgi:putative transposase
MVDIGARLQGVRPHVTATTVRQLSRILVAMVAMTGRVTRVGLARWAGKGGSYRTIQRFFATVIPWGLLFWVFFRNSLYSSGAPYLVAGDEVIVTKAGKRTPGLDRFCSSLSGKPVPGLACFTLSLVSVQERRSCPMRVEQVVRSDAEKTACKAKAAATHPQSPHATRRPGRPKGHTNTHKATLTLPPELVRSKAMLAALLQLITKVLAVTYVVLDGHLGHHHALQMARQCNWHLISKLRGAAALYFPYTGPYAGRGPRRKYGRKVAYANLPVHSLISTTVEGEIETRLSQAQRLPKEFAHPLPVVILVKTNRRTQAHAHVMLFSRARALAAALLVADDSLRFHSAFNFREATQDWGLEDLMTITPTGVTNAANLSLFMVNVAYRLRTDIQPHEPDYSVLDLKADWRGYTYVEETFKMLPEKPESDLFAKMRYHVACLGRIHASQPCFSFS